MRLSLAIVCLSIVVAVLADSNDLFQKNTYLSDGSPVDRLVLGKRGHPKFFSGNFGEIQNEDYHGYIISRLAAVLQLQGSEIFEVTRQEVDLGQNKHIVLQQFNKGLKVDGGEIILHIKSVSNEVFAVTASALPDTMDDKPQLTVEPLLAIKAAIHSAPIAGENSENHKIEGEVITCYLIFDDEGFLAYKALVTYNAIEDGTPKKEWIYISAVDGHLILENPVYKNALSRAVYSANTKTSLPGTLARSEGQAPTNDLAVNQAYDNSGACYNFYQSIFGRDSIDGNGLKLTSVVHYAVKYNNAFWDGVRMVYGDGDGKLFADFAGDLSVVCHELTHAVTSYTADLRYQGESGALNEAMSDIMGAASTVFRDGEGITKDTWHIGHACFLAGTALRYMNNPILDGASFDWYPTRYKGTQDNGGVHWNSGIANLAFVLMTQGGTHPQQKSTNWVEDIGIEQAQQIFYSALTQYMTQTTTFSGARAATETAAKILYGAVTEQTVSDAWDAVGVN